MGMGGIDVEINERKKEGEGSGLSIRWQEGSALQSRDHGKGSGRR